ncbi:uncharacterized protein LOC122862640 [Siniperca chuatsi]|uniref:uncharacterized protein LOC122862640 n=1 Tax=Siniperca chuatsi TaxID=119488 RepID=UPI001CE1063B|nr:uncharacterized protein LOC122862640 [Siniperca chuatsi]
MVKCVVSGCPNRMVNINRGIFNRQPKRFFNFPKDPARVKVWLAALRETDKQDSTEQHLICEDHFLPEDVSANGVTSDAIPIMPPYLDGPLGLISPWGAASSEEEEQWATGGCEEEEEDAVEDEGGGDAPPAPDPPTQQDPGRGLESPPEPKTSATLQQRKQSIQSKKATRQDVSLGLLTQRFLELLLAAPDGSLDLREVATSLETRKRRVYDITNILEGIDLIQKESASRIKWIGRLPVSSFLRTDQQKLQRELENLKLVEDTLDGLIKSCAQQLFDMTDDVENSASAYVTHEDVSRLRAFQEQTVIAVKAPEETKLEIPAPKEDSIQVHLKAGRGPIMVVTCEVGSGHTTTSDPGKRSGFFLTLEESRIGATTLHTVHGAPNKDPPASQTSDELFASLEAEFEDVPDELGAMSAFSEHQESDTDPRNPEEKPGQQNQKPEMGKPCGPTCRKKCWGKITEERREAVHATYWNMTYHGKKAFIFSRVSQRQIGRPTSAGPSRRSKSLSYHLTNGLGQSQEVCKTFFLTTLGYHPKNDRFIQTVIGNSSPPSSTPPKERCRRHAPTNKINLTPIYKHIESVFPTGSHYRRERAPNRRHLPSDVTAQLMEEFPANNKCPYETYRKAVKNSNISFAEPGEEQCQQCLQHERHVKAKHQAANQDPGPDCSTCKKWEDHKERAARGRHHYKLDAEKQQSDNLSIRSVNLQKVILLPRMPGVRTAVFTKRISVFHETFATVGNKTGSKKKSISVIWHEGIAGRKAEEVASAYVCALQRERGVPHLVLWMDSCTTTNKNWCLLTTLASVVNHKSNSTEDVTLKYFEPGHTVVSADSFHHGVEQEMKRRPGGVVLDFQDFSSVIASSDSGKVDVVELQNEDIRAWKAGHSMTKLKNAPHLAEMAEIQFRRGSRRMWVKLSHDQEEFTPLDFLMKKTSLDIPEQLRPAVKGVGRQKKADILTKLCPLMPPYRRVFWESLAESAADEE